VLNGLLIESGRRALDGPAAASSAVAASEWSALPDAAERHGMTAWVHVMVRNRRDAPAEVRAAIEARARAHHLRALHAVAQLRTLVDALRRAGIEPVALKGPLLSTWLYGDLGMRRFADLDLLIERGQRERALQVLSSKGYALRDAISVAAARVVYAGTGAWPLSHPAALAVDLHWRAQALGFPSPLSPAQVLRGSITIAGAGGDIRIPCATHAAVLALVHAAKHLWTSLELILAIAHLMRRTDVDWPRVQQLAARAGAWNACAAGMALAQRLFDARIPPPIQDRVQERHVEPLVQAALTFLSMPDAAGAPLREEFHAHCASIDTLPRRARYAAWRLLAPTPLESAWWPLPDRLAPLYAPVRLLRLAMRRGNRMPQ
jgi:putative nucleotidyltransferase-like protein